MKIKTTIILHIIAFVFAFANTYKHEGTGGGIDGSMDRNSFPLKIDNYIDTSGLYSSPGHLRELGEKWMTDENNFIYELSTNVIILARCAATNEIAMTELRKLLEFIISPKSISRGSLKTHDGKNVFMKKIDLLSEAFKLIEGNTINQTNVFEIGLAIHLPHTNSVVGIANAMAFVKSRRHVKIDVFSGLNYSPTDGFKTGTPVTTTKERYMPRRDSDNNEEWALRPMMLEVINAEKYLYQLMKDACIGMITNDTVVISNIIEQVSEIAELNEQETRELHEITERSKLLLEATKSEEAFNIPSE